jgi:hypothetical protein
LNLGKAGRPEQREAAFKFFRAQYCGIPKAMLLIST